MQVLLDQLRQTRETDASSKAVAFTQYPNVVTRVCNGLAGHGFTHPGVTRGMPVNQRDGAIEAFQEDDRVTVCGCTWLDACMRDVLNTPREFLTQ